ncbi:MAG: response regulator [Anaerolineae bacterium]|nr:response regulator [Anaerolineae bacterium]
MQSTVLYIEDNLDNMRIVQRTLEAFGYKFLWGGTGLLGLELAKRHCPDLILLDVNLTDIDGLEIARRIRSSTLPKLLYVPIIAITGDTREKVVKGVLNAGCDVYMEKPINLRELLARVEGFISSVMPIPLSTQHNLLQLP